MEGSVTSLAALHAAVPAAEALDLSEQAWMDRMAARFEEIIELATTPPGTDLPASDGSDDVPEPSPAGELTPRQVLGLLEHQLGATEIEE